MARTKEGRLLERVMESYNYVVGGHENAISDGFETEMPSFEDMQLEIYDTIIYGAEEYKFFGREVIFEVIKVVFEVNGEYSTEGDAAKGGK